MQETSQKEIDRLTEQLEAGIQNLRSSDGYKEYLSMQSRFPHYSARNCLLILALRPDATQVAGYTVWHSLGRQVKAGEHGIRIITPHTYKKKPPSDPSTFSDDTDPDTLHLYFRPTSVFDVSQTSGDPLPTLLVDELQGSVDGYAQIQNALIRISPVWPELAELLDAIYAISGNGTYIFPSDSDNGCLGIYSVYAHYRRSCSAIGILIQKDTIRGPHAWRRNFAKRMGDSEMASHLLGNTREVCEQNYSDAIDFDEARQRLTKKALKKSISTLSFIR